MRTVSFLESDALSLLLEILDLLALGVTFVSCLAYLGVFGGVGSASTRLRFAGVADCALAFRFTPFLHTAISSLCRASSFAILFSALAAFRRMRALIAPASGRGWRACERVVQEVRDRAVAAVGVRRV